MVELFGTSIVRNISERFSVDAPKQKKRERSCTRYQFGVIPLSFGLMQLCFSSSIVLVQCMRGCVTVISIFNTAAYTVERNRRHWEIWWVLEVS